MHNQPEDKALAELKRRCPWPDRCPDVPAVPWVMDYGGRELITRTVASRGLRTSLVRRMTAWQRARQGLDSKGNHVGKS